MLRSLLKKLHAQVDSVMALLQQPLKFEHRLFISTLLTQELHSRDIVSTLASESTPQTVQSEWESQLRTYWEEDNVRARGYLRFCCNTDSFPPSRLTSGVPAYVRIGRLLCGWRWRRWATAGRSSPQTAWS